MSTRHKRPGLRALVVKVTRNGTPECGPAAQVMNRGSGGAVNAASPWQVGGGVGKGRPFQRRGRVNVLGGRLSVSHRP